MGVLYRFLLSYLIIFIALLTTLRNQHWCVNSLPPNSQRQLAKPHSLFCEPLQRFQPSVCSHSIDYNVTIRPNVFGHITQEPSYKALLEYDKIFGNAESNCAELFELFVCALYLPQCVIVEESASENQPAIAMNTCYHTLCLDAREQCEHWLALFGMAWPLTLDCDSLFPADPPHCFYPMLKTTRENDARIARMLIQQDQPPPTTSTISTRITRSITPSNKETVIVSLSKKSLLFHEQLLMPENDQQISAEQKIPAWIRMNVGGEIYLSTRATMCRGSLQSVLLKKMFRCEEFLAIPGEESVSASPKPRNGSPSRFTDKNGTYLIDRDAIYFRVILNYLRTGKLVMDGNISEDGVLEEANYFNLTSLAKLVKRRIRRKLHDDDLL